MKSYDALALALGALIFWPRKAGTAPPPIPPATGSGGAPGISVVWDAPPAGGSMSQARRRGLLRADPIWLVNTSHTATVTVNNPNPIPIEILVNLKVGPNGVMGPKLPIRAKLASEIANPAGQQTISITAPSSAGLYAASIDFDWWADGVLQSHPIQGGPPFSLGNVQVYALQAPTVSVTW